MFDFGQLLSTLGHNFANNMQSGGPMGMAPGQPPNLQQRMMNTAQVLTGQPMGGQQQGQPNQQQLMQLLSRFFPQQGAGSNPPGAPASDLGTLRLPVPGGGGATMPAPPNYNPANAAAYRNAVLSPSVTLPGQTPAPQGPAAPQPAPMPPGGGLPLSNPFLAGNPSFGSMFARYGGGY